jgi:hypothetical protein
MCLCFGLGLGGQSYCSAGHSLCLAAVSRFARPAAEQRLAATSRPSRPKTSPEKRSSRRPRTGGYGHALEPAGKRRACQPFFRSDQLSGLVRSWTGQTGLGLGRQVLGRQVPDRCALPIETRYEWSGWASRHSEGVMPNRLRKLRLK